jgi:hypothetical protein
MASDDKDNDKSAYRKWFDDPYMFNIPDATYDDLPELIGSLKRAAIDAYVRNKLAPPPAFFTLAEDHYLITVNSGAGGGSTTRITRPNSDGEGGGKASTITTNFGQTQCDDGDFTSEFESVREEIKKILEPWIDLPKPERINEEMDDCRRIVSLLAEKASVQGVKIVPSGKIHTKIKSIYDNLTQMGGATIETFKSNIVENLDGIVGNLSVATTFWGATLGSEYGAFKKARESVVSAVKQGIETFNAIANNTSGKMKIALKIAEFAVDGFKIFSVGTKVVGAALDSIGLGLKAIDNLKDAKSTTKTSNTYDEGVSSLISFFNEINKSLYNTENAIQRNLIDNYGKMQEEKESYDLELKALKSSEIKTSEDKLYINESKVNSILHNAKPSITKQLELAKGRFLSVDITPVIRRNSMVGIGATGFSVAFHHFKWLLHDLVGRLTEEIDNSFKNFELAIEYIKTEDYKAKSELDNMGNTIDNHKGPDPWQDRD